jgi:Gpi18-like mannosyltransferase
LTSRPTDGPAVERSPAAPPSPAQERHPAVGPADPAPAASWAAFLGPFADLSRRLGGLVGHHAKAPQSPVAPGQRAADWLRTVPIMLVATVTWLILMIRQLPCRTTDVNQGVSVYQSMCYSDIGILYRVRGQATGSTLYWDIDWEYPVLSGYLAEFARRVTDFLGFTARADLDAQSQLTNANVYFAVNAVLLFVCFLVIVAIQRQLLVSHPWAVAAVAASPAIMTAALINWDLFAVMLTALGLWAHSRRKSGWAGLWFGLAVAAKFYPLVILGGLFALALRPLLRRLIFPQEAADSDDPEHDKHSLADFGRLAAAAGGAWLAANLPLMLSNWQRWSHFYSFNQNRPADLGSPWYALNLVGFPTPNAQQWALGLMIVGYAGIALLIVLAPVKPRTGQIAFLCVALMVSLNMVYSPQYVLWTLPLIVLARPVWPDLAAFTLAELAYFAAIWMYLDNNPWIYLERETATGAPIVYSLTVFLRVAVTWWIMALTVRDCWRPRLDPSRQERQYSAEQRRRQGVNPDGSLTQPATDPRPAGRRPLFEPALAVWVAVVGFVLSRVVLIFSAVVVGRASNLDGLNAVMRWDALIFAQIGADGYSPDPAQHQAAFFPGLPLLLRALDAIGVTPAVGGAILALVASAVAAWGLYRLAHGGVAGAVTVLAWSFAPMAVFTAVPYSEAFFLAFAVWAWVWARDGRWWLAGLLASGACLFRISGLFLVGALILLAVLGDRRPDWRSWDWRRIGRRLAWLGLPLAAILAQMAWQKQHFGSWLAWYQAQADGWGRNFHWPWEAWQATQNSINAQNADSWIFAAEIWAVVIGVVVTIVCLWRWRLAQAGWVGAQVASYACQTWFMSVARGSLLWFPLWLIVGDIANARLKGIWWWLRLALIAGLLLASAALMVVWAVRFYQGGWSG